MQQEPLGQAAVPARPCASIAHDKSGRRPRLPLSTPSYFPRWDGSPSRLPPFYRRRASLPAARAKHAQTNATRTAGAGRRACPYVRVHRARQVGQASLPAPLYSLLLPPVGRLSEPSLPPPGRAGVPARLSPTPIHSPSAGTPARRHRICSTRTRIMLEAHAPARAGTPACPTGSVSFPRYFVRSNFFTLDVADRSDRAGGVSSVHDHPPPPRARCDPFRRR